MAELDAKLQHVHGELGPLKQQLLVAKAELEARDSQVTRLQEDSRKWQERNAQLMSKVSRDVLGLISVIHIHCTVR
jgi:nucleoprotein TPR